MKPVTIVGGGLAGLALGIGLRQQGVPVTVWEAGRYPRHKVCGEFISGRGQETLARLGLREKLLQAGARWARDAAFYVNGGSPARFNLPQPALCLSRYVLDRVIADEFRGCGGELRERERWSGSFDEPGVVRASGHRAQAAVDGWRWFGLKAHARGVPMDADLELHFLSNGYVGLCRLADTVNVCGLFRSRRPIHDLRGCWKEMLAEPMRGRRVEWDEGSFCAVAGLCVEPHRNEHEAECAVGDALTMTPPATGNGMSMALESAELAVSPLAHYSAGEMEWEQTRREIFDACEQRFASRLRAAGRLHAVMFRPVEQKLLLHMGRWFPGTLRLLFARTR